eukprot:IDg17432t1
MRYDRGSYDRDVVKHYAGQRWYIAGRLQKHEVRSFRGAQAFYEARVRCKSEAREKAERKRFEEIISSEPVVEVGEGVEVLQSPIKEQVEEPAGAIDLQDTGSEEMGSPSMVALSLGHVPGWNSPSSAEACRLIVRFIRWV